MAMLIRANSRLSLALALHPDVLEYIISLNPDDFSRLRNPLMRKLMPPRIALHRVATMAGVEVVELLRQVHLIAGSPLDEQELNALMGELPSGGSLPSSTTSGPELPAWAMVQEPVVVDLLESDARLDADPMPPINRALNTNPVGAAVLIKHKWEPQPLYDVWDRVGIEHFSTRIREGEWWIVVRKTNDKKATK